MPLISTLKLEEKDKVLEDIVLLIKCTTFFGIQEEGQTKTLFEKYNTKIQDLPKIKQDNFWEKWYALELKKNEKLKDDIKFKQSIIYEICTMLLKLELPKSMVKKLSDHININEFGKGTDLQQNMILGTNNKIDIKITGTSKQIETVIKMIKEIIKLISSANYISKAI